MKETFYFSHDYNARDDEKIMNMLSEMWLEWYWLYWTLIEVLAQNKWKINLDSTKWLWYKLRCDNKLITQLLYSYDLFVIDEENWIFYNKRLLEHFEKRDKDKERKSEAGKKWMAKRWGKDNSVITENNTVITNDNKGKESKVKENKVNIKKKEFEKNSFEYKSAYKYFDIQYKSLTPSLIYLLNKKSEEEIIQEWCDSIDKLKRIDKYTEEQIDFIIDFTINDDFWFKQIQNTAKFRKKNKEWIPYFVVMIEQAKKWSNSLSTKKQSVWIARI